MIIWHIWLTNKYVLIKPSNTTTSPSNTTPNLPNATALPTETSNSGPFCSINKFKVHHRNSFILTQELILMAACCFNRDAAQQQCYLVYHVFLLVKFLYTIAYWFILAKLKIKGWIFAAKCQSVLRHQNWMHADSQWFSYRSDSMSIDFKGNKYAYQSTKWPLMWNEHIWFTHH